MTLRRRLEVWESDYGRADGWDVELDGQVVARLVNPEFTDMFWWRYSVIPQTEDAALAAELMGSEFWSTGPWSRLSYRSRALGVLVTGVLPAPATVSGQVNMRRLHVQAQAPGILGRLLLRARKLLRTTAEPS